MVKHTHNDAATEANYHVRAVSRALSILTVFSEGQAELGLAELSERLDLNKSTLIRLLSVLQEQEFVEQNAETGGYHLGIKAFEIGSIYYLHHLRADQVARPYMTALVNRWNCSANLAVLDRGQIVYIGIVEPRGLLRVRSSLGARLGVHYTALGKALLSELADDAVRQICAEHSMSAITPRTITDVAIFIDDLRGVRERGYSIDDEETLPGVRCVAAPIRDHTGSIIAALSASGSTLEVTPQVLPTIADDVMHAVAEISRRLGFRSKASIEAAAAIVG